MKKCTKCGESKPITSEYFGNDKDTRDGFQYQCKICTSLYRKAYREKNKETINEKKRIDWHKSKVRLECSKKKKLYREMNRETIHEKAKLWRDENRTLLREKGRKYWHDHKDVINERTRKWQREHRELTSNTIQKYRARKRKLPSTLTVAQWEGAKLFFGNTCAYCGCDNPLVREHVVPVASGGEYTHNNIIPACKSCNSSKRDKELILWFRSSCVYSEHRENMILKFLGYNTKGIQQLSLM